MAKKGIIPARAGFTRQEKRGEAYPGDHPRSRGVYMLMSMPDMRAEGSSPLARGLHCIRHPLPVESGIIPARAGFTPAGRVRAGMRGDHPRSRGVYP